MTEERINQFEKTQSQLNGLYKEIGLLSKKNPNELLNKFKLKFINQTISESNDLLEDTHKPYVTFSQFEEEELPSTSDVTLILEQYLNCLEKYRCDNIVYELGEYYWVINNKTSNIETHRPTQFKR